MACPRNDGIPNLLKFATAMNPAVSGTSPGEFSRVGNILYFAYRRNKAAVSDGVSFIVEWSDSLAPDDWSQDHVSEETVNQGASEWVTTSMPDGPGPHRFVRLRVVLP